MAKDNKKRKHSKHLSVLLYVVHVLPQACKSEDILQYIFVPNCTEGWRRPRNFHADFTPDGWNDHIIQPARDAVLDYYKVHMRPISLHIVLALKIIQPNFICFSALRRTIQRQRVHARQQFILVSAYVWLFICQISNWVSLPHPCNHKFTPESSVILLPYDLRESLRRTIHSPIRRRLRARVTLEGSIY